MSRIKNSIANHSLNQESAHPGPFPEMSITPKFDDEVDITDQVDFPVDALPPVMADMARAISDTERTPEALAGVCILSMVSASLGKGLQVQSGPERLTMANTYDVVSADSGTGKSLVFRHATKPFYECENNEIEIWKETILPELQTEKKMLEAQIKKLVKEAEKPGKVDTKDKIREDLTRKLSEIQMIEEKFNPPFFSTEDVTPEELAVLMASRDETLASLSADAGAVVNNILGRYSKLGRTEENIYVKAYSGDYCKVDRIGRKSIILKNPCLTVLLLVQPDKVESLLAESQLTEGGFIPRLDICHTNAEPMEIINNGCSIPDCVALNYKNLINDLINNYRKAPEPFIVKTTHDALERMNKYHNDIVVRRKSDLKDINSFAARWAEKAWRRAVVLHAGTYGVEAHKVKLSLDTAENAIAITSWFSLQQLNILQAGRDAARNEIEQQVVSLLKNMQSGIKASDIYRKRIVRTAKEAHDLLARMEKEGILTGVDVKPKGGGPISRICTIANHKTHMTPVQNVYNV